MWRLSAWKQLASRKACAGAETWTSSCGTTFSAHLALMHPMYSPSGQTHWSHTESRVCRKHVARSRQWRLLIPWGHAGKGWPWENYGSSQRKRCQHSQREPGVRSAVTAGFNTAHTLLMLEMRLVPEAGGEYRLLNSSVKPLWKGACQEHGNEIHPLRLWIVRGFGFHPKTSDLSLLCLEPLV